MNFRYKYIITNKNNEILDESDFIYNHYKDANDDGIIVAENIAVKHLSALGEIDCNIEAWVNDDSDITFRDITIVNNYRKEHYIIKVIEKI